MKDKPTVQLKELLHNYCDYLAIRCQGDYVPDLLAKQRHIQEFIRLVKALYSEERELVACLEECQKEIAEVFNKLQIEADFRAEWEASSNFLLAEKDYEGAL